MIAVNLKDGHHHQTKASYLLQGPQGIKGAKGSAVSILYECLYHKKIVHVKIAPIHE